MGQFLSFHPGGVRTLVEQMQSLMQRQTGHSKAPHMQFNAAETKPWARDPHVQFSAAETKRCVKVFCSWESLRQTWGQHVRLLN